ncbi:glycerophosphodiester phosphodiesterase [Pullulanibacillus sp. KACC 23026]|uniref:glycerophosphodiester phosphodiesterase n=1 Tax=Pullulanibacillus sp. KACC 23026 TaxID=3028315 RepID=UPI0023AF878F|nr:glycerophosphodiester phosphodiesterase [Pullulanibacillus sp. KACC 23026]WEG14362.1 glycerophosphodiester phosphodiesterase [Pullulanibacillus sp. KACC 23026]
MTIIYAHRGSNGQCPENTMAAFKQALKEGADGIELDVHLTKDGVPVIIHDETVDRTSNGNGFVKDYTLNSIKQLSMGSWKSHQYRAETIPTLEEFLEWVASTSLLINIELKNNIFAYKGMEKVVLNMVTERGLLKRTVFSSFNHESLYKIHLLNTDAETAPLLAKPLPISPMDYCRELGARGIHPHYRSVNSPLISELHANHLSIRPYTVNLPHFMRLLMEWNSDALITDYPWMAANLKKQLKQS